MGIQPLRFLLIIVGVSSSFASNVFTTLFIVVRQYHDRKHAFHIVRQMLAFGFDCGVEKPYYKRKTPLAVGGTRTQAQVLANNMAIAASALDHCAT